jgi:uridine phosphorylase
MDSATLLTLLLIWGVNAAAIIVIIRIQALVNKEEHSIEPDLEMTEYAYSDGQWVRL